MFETLKVLGALRGFGSDEFTVEQLATAAGVNTATTRTVLQRRRDLAEQVGHVTRAGPGGRAQLLRARPVAIEALLNEAWAAPKDEASSLGVGQQSASPIPGELVAAEHLLLQTLPTGAEERRVFLARVETNLAAATEAARQGGFDRAQTNLHLHVVETLRDLAMAEMDGNMSLKERRRLRAAVEFLRTRLTDVDETLGRDLLVRLEASPIRAELQEFDSLDFARYLVVDIARQRASPLSLRVAQALHSAAVEVNQENVSDFLAASQATAAVALDLLSSAITEGFAAMNFGTRLAAQVARVCVVTVSAQEDAEYATRVIGGLADRVGKAALVVVSDSQPAWLANAKFDHGDIKQNAFVSERNLDPDQLATAVTKAARSTFA